MSLEFEMPPHILSIEDNPADIHLIGELVRLCGGTCTVHFVRDGAEGIEYLRRQGRFWSVPRPNLILLDLNLPKKDGREVLQEIKGDPRLRAIPVIIFSSSSHETDISTSYDLHASCYIVKPASLEDFEHVLNQIREFWIRTAKLPSQDTRRVS